MSEQKTLRRYKSLPDDLATKQARPKWVNFALGASAALSGWLLVHPFDLIKVRSQLMGKRTSMPQVAKHVYNTSGVTGFYGGIGAAVIRQLTYGNLRLGIYATISEAVVSAKKSEPNAAEKLAMGMTAGGIASFLSNPIEISLVRMQSGSYNYRNVFHALYKVVTTEGVLTLWNGAVPTVTRAMVVNALQVGGYDVAKTQYSKLFNMEDGVPLHLLSSVSAGFCNAFATLPLDTAKTRMQNKQGQKSNMFKVIVEIVRKEGVTSLWNGFIPYFARCGGHTVTMFLFLEQYKKLANKAYPA